MEKYSLRQNRRDEEERDEDSRSARRGRGPEVETFSVMLDFQKFYATITFKAPEGFGADDVEDFIYDLKDAGYAVYKPKSKRQSRSSSRRGGGRYDRYDRDE